MQPKLFFSKWSSIAGLLLMGGALAWAIKLVVIISTNGRIINTGAAALFMQIGMLLLFVGSTGIGHRLTVDRAFLLRLVAMILSPAAVFASFLLFAQITGPIFHNSAIWYAPYEAPIGIGVIVYMAVGFWLYSRRRPAVH